MQAILEEAPSQLDSVITDQVRKALKYVLTHSRDKEWEATQAELDMTDRCYDVSLTMRDVSGENPQAIFKLHKSAGHANRNKVVVSIARPLRVAAKTAEVKSAEQKRQKECERKRLYRLRKKAEKQAAPELLSILERLNEKVRRANGIQHSGGKVRAEDWSELFTLSCEASSAIANASAKKR
jgi:aminopeptidase N